MKKVIVFMHVSLDGFTARPAGQMDWIKVSDEIFDLAGERTRSAGTALYGKNTFSMMDAYWPTAAAAPDASKHDIEHSTWYNAVNKVVVSTTLPEQDGITFIRKDVYTQVAVLKEGNGGDIVLFGSPALVSGLMKEGLVDEYWLFVNPVFLGSGIPLYQPRDKDIILQLIDSRSFTNGVTCLHYRSA